MEKQPKPKQKDRCARFIEAARKAAGCLIFATLAACVGTTAKMDQLRPGMSRAEVVEVMGRPDRTRLTDAGEDLIYQLARPDELIVDEARLPEYVVRLKNGEVTTFGRIDEVR